MNQMKLVSVSSILFGMACLFSGCLGQSSSSSGESTTSSTTADTAISSSAFTTTGATVRLVSDPGSGALLLQPGADYLAATVTDFKFCVKRIKLEGEDGLPKKKTGETGDAGEKDADDIKFAPGLIDVGSGVAKDWGTVNIPVGFKLKKIKIKVKKDKTLCGVDYSVSFNGQTTTEDVEFKWKFEPALDLTSATGALSLSFDTIVTALRNAADAGTLSKMKDHIEAAEDAGKKK